ncbi:MAG: DUF2059 domain-containing protein [Pseudomonadota bacterium]
MIRSVTLALGMALAATPALAQDAGRADRLAVATAYVEASLQDIDMSRVIAQMYQPIIDQVEASGQPVTETQKTQLQALYEAEFMEPMRSVMLAQDEIMADLFTLEEITALKEFYETSTGRSVMTKLPDVLAAQQPMILEMVGTKIPAMLPQIQAILAPN